jgi:hypothetical protein
VPDGGSFCDRPVSLAQGRQTISALHAKSTLSQGWATFNDPTSFLSPKLQSRFLSHPTLSFSFNPFVLLTVLSTHSSLGALSYHTPLENHIDSIPIPTTLHLPTFQPPTVTLFIHSPYPDSETKSPVVRLGMLETRVPDSSFSSTHVLRPGFRLILSATRRILR